MTDDTDPIDERLERAENNVRKAFGNAELAHKRLIQTNKTLEQLLEEIDTQIGNLLALKQRILNVGFLDEQSLWTSVSLDQREALRQIELARDDRFTERDQHEKDRQEAEAVKHLKHALSPPLPAEGWAAIGKRFGRA